MATILVVLFHSVGYYTYAWPFDGTKVYLYDVFDRFINQINMPLFVCISGYLYACLVRQRKYQDGKSTIKKKFKRLIIPYVVWSLVQLVIFPQTTDLSMLYTGCLHLWFLLMLFELFLIFIITKSLWINLSCKKWYILCVCSIFLSLIPNITSLFCINAVCSYLPFFILGLALSISIKKSHIANRVILGILSLGLVGLGYFSINNSLLSVPVTAMICKLCSLCIVGSLILLTSSIILNKSRRSSVVLMSLDKNSMGIYIIHHIIIWGIVQIPFLKLFLDSYSVIMPILIFITSLVISWFLSEIISRYKVLRIIIGS